MCTRAHARDHENAPKMGETRRPESKQISKQSNEASKQAKKERPGRNMQRNGRIQYLPALATGLANRTSVARAAPHRQHMLVPRLACPRTRQGNESAHHPERRSTTPSGRLPEPPRERLIGQDRGKQTPELHSMAESPMHTTPPHNIHNHVPSHRCRITDAQNSTAQHRQRPRRSRESTQAHIHTMCRSETLFRDPPPISERLGWRWRRPKV